MGMFGEKVNFVLFDLLCGAEDGRFNVIGGMGGKGNCVSFL